MQPMDLVAVVIALIALIISLWAAWTRSAQRHIAEKEMGLRAYSAAINGILDLKRNFAELPRVFKQQMDFVPELKDLIPDYMDIETFLTFARGMWQLSFVYTAMIRGEEMGLNNKEIEAVRNEMLLWLRDVPGFYDVYCQHTRVLKVHNKDFLEFLENKVYDSEYRRKEEPRRKDRLRRSSGNTNNVRG